LNKNRFVPGEAIEGEVAWSQDPPPIGGELRVLWWTEGKGDTDSEVVGRIPFEEMPAVPGPGASFADASPYRQLTSAVASQLRAEDRRRFHFTMPTEPESFSGKLITLHWAIEVELPGLEVVREKVVVSWSEED
jgi:hypothetical protein